MDETEILDTILNDGSQANCLVITSCKQILLPAIQAYIINIGTYGSFHLSPMHRGRRSCNPGLDLIMHAYVSDAMGVALL